MLLFPFKLAFGSEFRKADSPLQNSIKINQNLPIKISSVPDPPDGSGGRTNGGTDGGGTRLRPALSPELSRGEKCPEDANGSPDLTLLIPDSREGLTVAEYPTFFAFVPQTKASRGEFILYDRTEEKLIYRTTFDLTGIPGIVSVQLPKDKASLKIGNDYEWRFSLQCKSNGDRATDPMKIGLIKRIAANRAVASIRFF